jgi:hypothetical protein
MNEKPSVKGSSNIKIDINILQSLVNTVILCKNCGSSKCFHIFKDVGSRKGMATSLVILCSNCGYSLNDIKCFTCL